MFLFCFCDGVLINIIFVDSSASYSELKGFLEESMLMCNFDHPHVLGLIGISLDSNHSPYLLLPFMENGDLREFLKNKRGTSVSNITKFPMVHHSR